MKIKSKIKVQKTKLPQFPLNLRGQVMILALVALIIILILSASLFSRVANFIRFNSNQVLREQASGLVDAGVDYALYKLNETAGSYLINPGETEIKSLSIGETEIKIETKSQSLKTITTTAYIPDKANARVKRSVKVDALIDATQISFNYAVQVGAGGVFMKNSSEIIGTVYTNGNIEGENLAQIDGDAFAVGTISTPPVISGNPYPGSPTTEMPTIDYQSWKDEANINNDPITCSPTCTISSGSVNIGPQKYIGNLTISNSAIVTIQGPIHITNSLNIKNSAQVNLDESFGSNGTVIITDGIARIKNNADINPTSANPKGYLMLISTSTHPEAIQVENKGANALLYALDGGIELENQAQATALVANSLEMENSAQLTYDSGLASAQFSTGPGGSWQIKKGTYKYTSSP